MTQRLGDLARMLAGVLNENPDLEIHGVASLDEAGPADISFIAEKKHVKKAQKSGAAALIAGKDVPDLQCPLIRVDNPRLAFAQVLEIFSESPAVAVGVHPSAVVGDDVVLGREVSIQAHVSVGDGARIGDGTVIYPGVYIGHDAVIGRGTVIYPNVTVCERVRIGANCIIHPGVVIGSDGFGYVRTGQRQYKVPHIGSVEIGDDVEIGANTTIDRGTVGRTAIGRGTKIDNLVQIAHNVEIGEDCIIVAMTGIAGSSKIGDRCIFAGQSGVAGHLHVEDDCVVASRGLVAGDLKARSYVSGFPARPHPENMKILAATRKLPDLLHQVGDIVARLDALEKRGTAPPESS